MFWRLLLCAGSSNGVLCYKQKWGAWALRCAVRIDAARGAGRRPVRMRSLVGDNLRGQAFSLVSLDRTRRESRAHAPSGARVVLGARTALRGKRAL